MKKYSSRLTPILIIIAILITIYLLGIIQKKYIDEEDINNREIVSVKKVVDGDTISVILSGEVVSVRLIGVDSPEKTTTRYGYTECYGEESSNYLKELLPKGTNIQLEYDQTQGLYDKHDRILGYVFLSGVNINEKIIRDGYGWEYTYNLPYRYQSDFIKAENYAIENNLGLWKECNGERIAIEKENNND